MNVSPLKYIASCMSQPTPSAFIRSSVAGVASLRCAMDQRSPPIGTSRLTRSNTSSRCPTDFSFDQ
jgi:hypothetical protein